MAMPHNTEHDSPGTGLPLLQPMLAVKSGPFDSPDYLFEIKWDGYRGLAYLGSGKQNSESLTTLWSRNQVNLTGTFPELSKLHQRVKKLPAIIDGEIVVLGEGGKPSFAGLQSRARGLTRVKTPPPNLAAVFIAFDVLYAGGKRLLETPLEERKAALEEMLLPGPEMILSGHVLQRGLDYYQACTSQGLEGVVAKRLGSPYLPGRRSQHWKKIRHTLQADLIICGYQTGKGGRALGSLVLGAMEGGKIIYQGKVGTGFTVKEASILLEHLGKIEAPGPVMEVPRQEAKKIVWVQPVLVCQVQFLTTTAEGYLRHPVYQGLRWDKGPGECRRVELQ